MLIHTHAVHPLGWDVGMWQLMHLFLSKRHFTMKKQFFPFLTIKNHKSCYVQFRGSLRNAWWVLVWQQALEASPALQAVRSGLASHTEAGWGFPVRPFTCCWAMRSCRGQTQMPGVIPHFRMGSRRAWSPQEPQTPCLSAWGQLSGSLPSHGAAYRLCAEPVHSLDPILVGRHWWPFFQIKGFTLGITSGGVLIFNCFLTF